MQKQHLAKIHEFLYNIVINHLFLRHHEFCITLFHLHAFSITTSNERKYIKRNRIFLSNFNSCLAL